MAFDLSGFLGNYHNSGTVNVHGNADLTVSASATKLNLTNSALGEKLLALLPGQMVQGEVVSMEGNQVQLLLGNEMLLNASLDSQIGINPGQLMSFQVKSNTGSLVSLIPLSVNLTTDENVMKALNEASLPVTDKTIELVNSLMKEGMPIDRDTLAQMNKEMMTHPNTEVETLVQMARLKIPVTAENIEQFTAYKNYNHKLADGISELQNQLFHLANAGGKEGVSTENSQLFMRQLLQFLSGENGTDGSITLKPAGAEQQGTAVAEAIVSQTATEANVGTAGQHVPGAVGDNATAIIGNAVSVEGEVLSLGEKQNFLSLLKELGVDESTLHMLANGKLDGKQLASLLQNEQLNGEQLTQLFSSKEFDKLFQNELTDQLLLKPEMVTKESVEEYYTDLKNHTAKLMQILESAGQADSPAAKTVQNLNRNVDFLNQLNQMFTYVQLPLKMANDTAHGDLYVYTNKKNLAKKDGNVSALLHLDMPHLGMVDVYVAMQAERVSTKFYLQNEEMMDFMEEHMELLTSRLEKKGYQANVQVVLKEKQEKESIIHEILEQNKNVPEYSSISMRSFDVRA